MGRQDKDFQIRKMFKILKLFIIGNTSDLGKWSMLAIFGDTEALQSKILYLSCLIILFPQTPYRGNVASSDCTTHPRPKKD